MNLDFAIEIDGGVAMDTVAEIVRAGAEILVAGNAIFGQGDAKLNTERLLKAANDAMMAKV
jgi:ribulose-phosphate 3-epimerase